MSAVARTIRAHYDGRCFVPDEPVELEPDTAVNVVVAGGGQTWASLRLGIPPIRLRGEGASLSEAIIQEREQGY